MTPSQARAFLAVATEGSFTAAARCLAVSQPTVTSQVGDIEKKYKVELFHRSARGASLTPAGAVLLPLVRRMFASFEEALGARADSRHACPAPIAAAAPVPDIRGRHPENRR